MVWILFKYCLHFCSKMSNFQWLFSILFEYLFRILFRILFQYCSKNVKITITVFNTVSTLFSILFENCFKDCFITVWQMSKINYCFEYCLGTVCVWILSWEILKYCQVNCPITLLACDHFSKTVCVTVCSWCFFVVANDCPYNYVMELAKLSHFPLCLWTLFKNCLRYCLFVVFFVVANDCPYNYVMELAKLSHFPLCVWTLFKNCLRYCLFVVLFLLLRMIAHTITWWSSPNCPISLFACEHCSKTFCVTVCSWCFFVVANDCPYNYVMELAKLSHFPLCVWTLFKNCLRYCLFVVLFCCCEWLPIQLRDGARQTVPFPSLRVNIVQKLFALLFVRGAFSLLRMIAHTITWWSSPNCPISLFACEHCSKTVCVTVCSWCFFVVANDCPYNYVMELAKLSHFPLCVWTLFKNCLRYCLFVVLFCCCEWLPIQLRDGARQTVPFPSLRVNIVQKLFALLFVRGAFLLLRMIAHTITWWSSPRWSISLFACEHCSKTVCVSVCSWCFFVVANDCPYNYVMELAKLSHFPLCVWTLFKNCLRYCLFVVLFCCCEWLPIQLRDGARQTVPFPSLRVNIVQKLFALLFVRGAFLLLRMIAHTITWWSSPNCPISLFACEHCSKTVCVTVCSWCFFVVANDCPYNYVMELAKLSHFPLCVWTLFKNCLRYCLFVVLFCCCEWLPIQLRDGARQTVPFPSLRVNIVQKLFALLFVRGAFLLLRMIAHTITWWSSPNCPISLFACEHCSKTVCVTVCSWCFFVVANDCPYNYVMELAKLSHFPLCVWTLFKNCLRYCLFVVLFCCCEWLPIQLRDGARQTVPFPSLRVNIVQKLFALLFVRGAFLLLRMIAHTITWWSSPNCPISLFACEHCSKTVCVTVCSWCFFVVVNDCPYNYVMELAKLSHFPLCVWTLFKNCLRYCLFVVLFCCCEWLPIQLRDGARQTVPFPSLRVNIVQKLFALLFVRGAFLLLRMIAHTITWWSSPNCPISLFACEHCSKTVCVTVCSWCFFVVANDCPYNYVMELAKLSHFPLCVWTLFKNCLRYCLFVVLFCCCEWLPIQLRDGARQTVPFPSLRVNIVQKLFALLFVRGAFLLRMIAHTITWWSSPNCPISLFACEHCSKTVCVTVCSWCFFVVANDCPYNYVMELAKLSHFPLCVWTLFKNCLRYCLFVVLFLLLRMIAHTITWWSSPNCPISLFACEHCSKTVCVTVCSWCFFVVWNDCPYNYVMELAKVVSILHHRVRADLPETSQHWVWTIWLL